MAKPLDHPSTKGFTTISSRGVLMEHMHPIARLRPLDKQRVHIPDGIHRPRQQHTSIIEAVGKVDTCQTINKYYPETITSVRLLHGIPVSPRRRIGGRCRRPVNNDWAFMVGSPPTIRCHSLEALDAAPPSWVGLLLTSSATETRGMPPRPGRLEARFTPITVRFESDWGTTRPG